MSNILTIDPKLVSVGEFHNYMLGSIAPRPIAFVSTIDKEGNVNLSPFSFFNAFGANPPLVIFSPARRVRDNTTKHTLENVWDVPEAVINMVNYPMVEQMSLASTEYAKGVNEFVKAGFTPLASERVKPPRVAESPACFECVVKEVIETGKEGGAAILVICEIVLGHFNKDYLDQNNRINPQIIDLVGRMGGDYYVRASGEALFEVEKPTKKVGIGVDLIPSHIRLSEILTGNNLGKLGNVEQLPEVSDIEAFAQLHDFKKLKTQLSQIEYTQYMHTLAQDLLHRNQTIDAWKVLLY